MDNDIISLTGDNTVHYIHAISPSEPYVEYEFYDEEGILYEEGKEIEANYYLQVDIFSKGSFCDLKNIIIPKLIDAGFTGGHGPDLFEKDTELNHKALRFNFAG